MRTSRIAGLVLAAALALTIAAGGGPARAAETSDLFKGFQSGSKGPIQVDAAALEIAEQNGQRISTFSGGVTVTRGDTVLKAATIKLYEDNKDGAKPAAGGQNTQFSRIEASGSVEVRQGPQVVTGRQAVFNTKANTIVMSGDVVLTQGQNVITGDRLLVDLNTGVARVEQEAGKRIRGVFTPDDKKAGTAPAAKTP
jgi:lipopolysaccharide export system protein LptA